MGFGRRVWQWVFGRPRRVHATALEMEWPTMWYENEHGERWTPPDDPSPQSPRPEGFHYMRIQDVSHMHEMFFRVDGLEGKKILDGEVGFGHDVVEAMVRAGFALDRAMLICANACERCGNALAWEFGVGGYEHGSWQWEEAGTSCLICERGIA